ncbi:hypothetical protein [Teichococcus vastitatis]|uniref:hypothetical protein n=1 Tax=Teichococcus vastitatis TaxID=2307076 RepID=UPI001EE3E577|nr:hypothetical protein [Pseudoroseomonas vastitatis]
MVSTLADVLERFNRKERNLLIRDALGHKNAPLRLGADFRRRVAEKLDITSGIPEVAWWATDYHIGWLAGALTLYMKGETALNKPQPNELLEGRRLVEGNQEDIDLLIAWDDELVMIEAKAYGAFGNAQIASKLARLDLLHKHYLSLHSDNARPVRFHLLLTSPRPPQKLAAAWPSWGCRGTGVPWIPLEMEASLPVLTVTRCNLSGKSSAGGDHWKTSQH